jgi:hypothetical protein
MDNIQMSVASLIIGAVLSYVTSWYFFKRSVDKRLTVHLQFASQVLAGVEDPAVRKELEILYRGVKIDDLLQVQFVVVNDGPRPIRDLIEPLNLVLPAKAKLLEARIPHVEPKGREVKVETIPLDEGKTKLNFRFSLLNSGEHFFIRLLLNGVIKAEKLRFNISGDDLPPTLTPKARMYETSANAPETGALAIFFGLVPLVGLIGVLYVAGLAIGSTPALLPGDESFLWFSWRTAALVGCLGVAIYLLSIVVRQVFLRGFLGGRHRFIIPSSKSGDQFGSPYWSIHAQDQKFEMLERMAMLPAHERNLMLRRLRAQTGGRTHLSEKDRRDL